MRREPALHLRHELVDAGLMNEAGFVLMLGLELSAAAETDRGARERRNGRRRRSRGRGGGGGRGRRGGAGSGGGEHAWCDAVSLQLDAGVVLRDYAAAMPLAAILIAAVSVARTGGATAATAGSGEEDRWQQRRMCGTQRAAEWRGEVSSMRRRSASPEARCESQQQHGAARQRIAERRASAVALTQGKLRRCAVHQRFATSASHGDSLDC